MLDTIFCIAFALAVLLGAGMLADTLALALRFRRTTVTSLLLIVAAASIIFSVLFGSMFPMQFFGRALCVATTLICVYFGYETLEHDYLSKPMMAVPAYLLIEILNGLV